MTFTRGSTSTQLFVNNDVLARFPADTLSLVLYGGNDNENIRIYSLSGSFTASTGMQLG